MGVEQEGTEGEVEGIGRKIIDNHGVIMPNYACFLITILYEGALMRCALRVSKLKISGDCEEYPMEPENRAQLHALLPDHVRSCGPIVAVEDLFEVQIVR